MTVDEAYTLMKFIVNKSQMGYFGPSNFNTAINQGSRSYQSFLLGSFQTYTPGRPVAKVELGQNRTVRQRLAPTIYGYILPVDPTGFSPYPGDFLQVDAMWSIYNSSIYHKRIRYAQQNTLDSFYNSVIDPVSSNPIYLIEDEGFQFYPENTYQAKLSYVKDVPEIVWGYDEDSNGRPIYNAAKSVDPVWDNVAMYEVIVRALLIIGINLQATGVMQYADEIRNGGQ